MDISRDIEQLDDGIRHLKVQYDQYFAGALARPPFELRTNVEKLIKKYSNAPIEKLSQRFHFNSLVSRFNTFSELWAKCVRLKEEGRPLPGAPLRAGTNGDVATESASHNGNGNGHGRQQAGPQVVLAGPDWEPEQLRPLYQSYREALEGAGTAGSPVSFDSFARQIARKADDVRNRAACDAIGLRIIMEGGRVSLKARPLCRRREP